ncbi:hypothetical protein KSF_044880 [Reticulibacter mediterranei]|uniref:Uncharacterized protein n=1 Tax=Reticulibacter mediterranei TaxID=2778369 RepID=A0A8J3IPB0_9CHLR|nr:hypothetical protein KSF_044880 [Reticulibacter mediterranei]
MRDKSRDYDRRSRHKALQFIIVGDYDESEDKWGMMNYASTIYTPKIDPC